MVFFTCNACGASLKKNQVEKHYQNECRNCEVLSCMDCGQDFYGDAYAGHTKCISEAEKYQGALYKESGKTGAGKGERKQQEWLERVKQSVSSAKVNPRVASLLEKIAECPNIPRKRAKFENFVGNSFNVRDRNILGQLWEAFSEATKKPQVEIDADKRIASDQQNGDVCKTEEKSMGDNDGCEKETRKKTKKKHKLKVDSNDAVIPSDDTESKSDDDLPKQKKKKRKHVETEEAEDVESDGGDPVVIKKTKKKKKHKEKVSDGDEVVHKKHKRSRGDDIIADESEQLQLKSSNGIEHEPIAQPAVKKHKKKHKSSS